MRLTYTLLTNDAGRVSKKVVLVDGKPKKLHGKAPWRGTAEVKTVGSLAEFAAVRANLDPRQSITFGVPRAGDCRIGVDGKLADGEVARTAANWCWPSTPSLLAFDGDYGTLTRDQIVASVVDAIGQPVDALWTPSATGYIVNALDDPAFTEGGHRVYVPIDDPNQIDRVLKAVIGRLVLAGHAVVRLDTIGRFHHKTVVDGCMSQPERLDYGAAEAGPGMFVDKNAGKIYPGSQRMILADMVADLTPDEHEQIAAIYAAGEVELQGEASKRREASGRTSTNSTLPLSHVLRLRDGDERTIEDVLADNSLGDVVEMYDPVEPDYSGDPRVAKFYRANRTNGAKPAIYSHLHNGVWYDIEPSRAEILAGFEVLGERPPAVVETIVVTSGGGGDHRTRIREAKTEAELRTAAAYVRGDASLDGMARETLAAALRDAFKAIDMPVPITETRKLVKRTIDVDVIVAEAPDWTREWVWITGLDRFSDGVTLISRQSFNAMLNREMPRNDEGRIVQLAADYALNDAGMQTVDKMLYLPFVQDRIIDLRGERILNSYRHDVVPTADASPAAEDIERLKNHLRNLCGNREAVWTALEWWMAHQVQRPGRKVRWSPLIKGCQGDGKTTLRRMLMAAMGVEHVGTVGNAEIESKFTDWANGRAVIAIEEMFVAGQNRHVIVNALKPLITNDDISIHKKGHPPFTAINTCNYLAFTNRIDAIPIDGDRRWFVIVSPFTDRRMLDPAGMGVEYFDALYEIIDRRPGTVRAWLESVDLRSFDANRLPEINDQDEMADADMEDDEMWMLDVLTGPPSPGVTPNAFLSPAMAERVREHGAELRQKKPLQQMLGRHGFKSAQTRLANGRKIRLWYRGSKDAAGAAIEASFGAVDPFS